MFSVKALKKRSYGSRKASLITILSFNTETRGAKIVLTANVLRRVQSCHKQVFFKI